MLSPLLLLCDNHTNQYTRSQNLRKLPKLVTQLSSEYIELASHLVLSNPPDALGPFGYDLTHPSGAPRYPIEAISALAYLQSPLRRTTVLEQWSPLDMALFEAALAQHGKYFHKVAHEIPTKTTKQCIDFYYIWKKAAPDHYRQWKQTYVPEYVLNRASDESSTSEEEEDDDDDDDSAGEDNNTVKQKPGHGENATCANDASAANGTAAAVATSSTAIASSRK